MKRTGAQLAVHALEQLGIRYTFGIPGVHNTELYDELGKSDRVEPVLVTHEGGGAFMADGVSRTSDDTGTLVIVPAAGMSHAMSGIGEAFLDGIPMLVISGGIRRDSGKHYQLHAVDQGRILDGIIKKYALVETHADVIPTLYDAYRTAHAGEPGPVFVEIPVELQLFRGEVDALPDFEPASAPEPAFADDDIARAADLLTNADRPGIYVGWGAVDAADVTAQIAERLAAPVSTTLQGISAFPADHDLHTGVGFGPSAVPAAQVAFEDCDALLAVGCRFGELATGSYGLEVPDTLIHVDINPEVFDKNYPAAVSIEGDAGQVLQALADEVEVFEAAYDARLPVLLKGPTGCGKTRFVERMAARLGLPLHTVACHDDLSAADLIGRYLLKGGETVWVDGPLTRAVRAGGICYLDEVVEARKDVTVVLHPLTDDRRVLPLERTGELLEAPPEFMLVVSYNPGYQHVLKNLKPSTRQRFVSHAMDFPPPEVEAAVVAAESGLDPPRCNRLVNLAGRLRELRDHDLEEVVSTRLLIYCAVLINAGMPVDTAARSALIEPLTDDPHVGEALAEEGARVTIMGRRQELLRTTAEELGIDGPVREQDVLPAHVKCCYHRSDTSIRTPLGSRDAAYTVRSLPGS